VLFIIQKRTNNSPKFSIDEYSVYLRYINIGCTCRNIYLKNTFQEWRIIKRKLFTGFPITRIYYRVPASGTRDLYVRRVFCEKKVKTRFAHAKSANINQSWLFLRNTIIITIIRSRQDSNVEKERIMSLISNKIH